MADEKSHQLARQVVAKLCQPLGWQGMQSGACDVLADLLKRYVITMGRTTSAYVANANRTDATLDDVAYAFEDLGISMDHLSVYSRRVDSSPLPSLPHFPLPRPSSHIYSPPPLTAPTTTRPRPSLSEEDEEGEDESGNIIPPYFPPLPSKKLDDEEDDAESGVHDSVDREGSVESTEVLPTPADPLRGLPQMFRSRSRLSSDISEEGGEGGSRRGSFSEPSGLISNRGVSESAGSGSRVTGDTSNKGGNLNAVEISSSATEALSSIPSKDSSNQVDSSLTKVSAVAQPEISGEGSTIGHQVSSDPQKSELRERERTKILSSRPPPLQLMSSAVQVDFLPVISPLLPSPLLGGVRPPLPLLSPLSTTPTTTPNPSAKLPPIALPTPTLPVSPPQLVPTAKSLASSAQPRETFPPTKTERHMKQTESETRASPVPPLPATSLRETVSSQQETSSAESPIRPAKTTVMQTPDVKPPASFHHSPEKTDRLTSESFAPPPQKEKAFEEEVGEEGLSYSDEETPSPEEKQSEVSTDTGKMEISVLPPPLEVTPTNTSARLPAVEVKSEVQLEEEDDDNESVISSASSKASFQEPEKQDRETGFSRSQSSTREEERNVLTTEQVRRKSREVSIADINTEWGGEGGVACILDNDEEEMHIPDIDKQLELSDSEESISSGTSSGSETELPETMRISGVERGAREKEEEEGRVLFLEPPKPCVRSSSHSLASTPSVSPSPSPIPSSHAGTSLHSIPVSTPSVSPSPSPIPSSHAGTSLHSIPVPPVSDQPTDPYLKPLTPSSVQKDVAIAKSSRQISGPRVREATGPLVVTIKTELVPSLREGGRRGRGKGGGGGRQKGKRQRKDTAGRAAALHKDTEKKQKKCFSLSQRGVPPSAGSKIKSEPASPLIVCIKRSLLHQELSMATNSDLLPQPEYEEEEEEDDDVIVTHSSAERVKFKLPAVTERVKTETPSSKGWYGGQQGAQYSAPEGPTPGQGVWRRELDISEMGLVAPPPPPPPPSQETQQVRIIPQSSSSSSSGESDSESDSSSPSPLSHPPHTLPSAAPSPTPLPWQRPIKSEDEESTSSSATGGSGGLKLKLKISKAFLQSMPALGKQLSGKPGDKKHRKKGAPPTDAMATTSRGGREAHSSRKRKRSNKNPQKKSGSNIPQIKLPKLELSAFPGGAASSSSWQKATPRSERAAGLYPSVKLPGGVAVSPGGEVWYCPQCSNPDDGSPMIGCDGNCEGWYHWFCVGITQAPPENERWFCPSCARKSKKKSRKRRN